MGRPAGKLDQSVIGYGSMERAYRNLGFVLLALVPIFIAGFWVPYLSQIPAFDAATTPPVHIHAVLLFSWIVLMIAQPLAIRFGAYPLHRLLGKVSYVLMALIVPFSLAMIVKEYRENILEGASPHGALQAEFLSSAQLTLTIAMYVLAVFRIYQRDVSAHMRYMISIAIFLLPAGLSRTLGYWFNVGQVTSQTISLGVIELCFAMLIAFDLRRHLKPRPYLWAWVAYTTLALLWFALGRPV